MLNLSQLHKLSRRSARDHFPLVELASFLCTRSVDQSLKPSAYGLILIAFYLARENSTYSHSKSRELPLVRPDWSVCAVYADKEDNLDSDKAGTELSQNTVKAQQC